MSPRTIHADGKALLLRAARIDEIIVLRHRILRAGLPVEAAHFDGDHEPTTRHAGVFDGNNAAVGCATMVLNTWQVEPAWQLRGMATDEAWQGHGLGRALLDYVTELALATSATRLLWCNARVPALAFYERQGWQIVSDEFDIPTAGPHRKMMRWL
jgi:GNAT superfamily N-acetyltransferase